MMQKKVGDDELVALFPGEPITHDNAEHYRGRLRRELLVNRCDNCGSWHQPPKPICPECWSTSITPTPVDGAGTIFMAIFLHQGPLADGVDYSTPYPVVTVDLTSQPGVRFTSTVVGSPNEDITIGAPVVLDWTTRGAVPFPVFRLDTKDRAL